MSFDHPLRLLPLAYKFRITSVNEQPSEFKTDQLGFLAVLEGKVGDVQCR